MANIGWIKLHRQITECEVLWDSSEEPFDRRSAWIDLLLMANHKDKRLFFRGKAITVKSGQRVTSLHKLAERWHWGINRVRKYLDLLQGEDMIIRESDNTKTLITIVNYQKYQGFDEFDETQTDTVTNTPTDIVTDTVPDIAQIHQQIPNNNDKNDKRMKKNEKNTLSCQQVVEMFNSICVSFPRVMSLSKARTSQILSRLKTYTLGDFQTVFTRAESSSFLKGQGGNSWQASFDWMIKESNFIKILEGNYQDEKPKRQQSLDSYADMLRDFVEGGSGNG